MRVKKGDTVVVIAGKDKGKKGTVVKVMPKANRVVVEGVNVITKHQKPNAINPQATVRAFQKAFGRDHFYAEVFSGERINPKKTDLVLSSAGTYRRAADVGSRDIGSLVSDRFPDPNHAEGSVFVVRKGNRTYQSLKDLKGLRLVTSGPKAA